MTEVGAYASFKPLHFSGSTWIFLLVLPLAMKVTWPSYDGQMTERPVMTAAVPFAS